jgi:multiple sugar transport system substrate-binding protein
MRKLLSIAVLAGFLLTGASCLSPGVNIVPITLTYWRVDDDTTALDEPLAAYQKLHPNVTVVVTKMRTEDYERTLRQAFANGTNPDIFSIPNTWIGSWKPNMLPLPKETVIPTQIVQDGKVVAVNQKTATLSLINLNGRYVEGVAKEVVMNAVFEGSTTPVPAIWGLPLSADSMGLYYNRDILRRANIESPPRTWRDVQELAIKLTVLEELVPDASGSTFGQIPGIRQSGAPLGLAKNVNHYTEILAAIMAQNGATLAADNGYASFHLQGRDPGKRPAEEALQFYQSFAIYGSQNYAWNDKMANSLDAFIAGTSAFYFGYPHEAKIIRERAPRLDLGVAPMPQVDPSVPFNILSYPVEAVAKNTQHPNEAWDVVQFITNADNVRPYLTATKRPTALRSLIESQLSDADVGPFAGQVLTAKGWYKGGDYAKVRAAFQTMIETYPTALQPDYAPIVSAAAAAVNATNVGN